MKTSALYKKTVLSALVAILVASVFCIALYPSTADALSWGGKDTAELWYYAESFLDVANAKQAVADWDLSKVKEPVVIAVIDTGIDVGHELFDGVLVKNADGDILGYNAYTGADSEGNVNIGDTSNKHGSQVAGIIAMLIKEFGLEDYVKIYPIKANTTGSDSFNFAVLAKALDWAVDNAGASVINMSLGRSKKDYDTLDASGAFRLRSGNRKSKRKSGRRGGGGQRIELRFKSGQRVLSRRNGRSRVRHESGQGRRVVFHVQLRLVLRLMRPRREHIHFKRLRCRHFAL